MDKLISFTQLVISVIMFLLVVVEVVAHIVMGNIISFMGYLVSFIFIFLTAKLLHLSWTEYCHEKNR